MQINILVITLFAVCLKTQTMAFCGTSGFGKKSDVMINLKNVDTSLDSIKPLNRGGLPPWIPSFGTAALGGLLFGSDIGASSSVVRIIGQGTSDLGDLNTLQLGQIASASLFGAMSVSAVLIWLGDSKIGRKKKDTNS